MRHQTGKFLSENRTGKPAGRRRRKKNFTPLILTVVLLLVVAAALMLTMRKDDLSGQWLYGSTVYSFDGKGQGTMELEDGVYAYTYELKKDSLVLSFEDDRLSDTAYTCVITEDKLILNSADAAGASYELIRRTE